MVSGFWTGTETSRSIPPTGSFLLVCQVIDLSSETGTARASYGLAFYAKVSGFWIHRESSNTMGHPSVISFGKEGDQSVVGDWRGWGVTRLGVFRNGQWIMRTSGVDKFNSAENSTLFGQLGDVAVPWPSK
jgi:hypothetical protein